MLSNNERQSILAHLHSRFESLINSQLEKLEGKVNKLMLDFTSVNTAVSDLVSAVTANTSEISALVALIQAPNTDQNTLNSVAASIEAQVALINSAVTAAKLATAPAPGV